MSYSSKEDKIKKEIIRYVIVLGVFIFIIIKLLGIDILSSLNSRLISTNEETREHAIAKLKSLDSSNKEKHIDFLIKALKDQNNPSRYLAAYTLSQIGPLARKAIPELIEALKSNNYDVRWDVLHTLANLGPVANQTAPAVYPLLLKAENKYAVGTWGNGLHLVNINLTNYEYSKDEPMFL